MIGYSITNLTQDQYILICRLLKQAVSYNKHHSQFLRELMQEMHVSQLEINNVKDVYLQDAKIAAEILKQIRL
jgi:hypothetical protein